MRFFRTAILVLVSTILFAGCNTLDFTVNFKDINSLKADDPVLVDQTPVGRVTTITPPGNGSYAVSVAIDKEFKAFMTEHSVFRLASSPETPDRTVIRVTQAAPGGTPLQKGAIVQGSEAAPVQGLSGMLKKLETGFGQFLEEMGKIPESEEYKRLESAMDEFAKELKDSGKEVQETMKNEILPKLRKELETLKERLKDGGRELEPLEKKLDTLKEI
ncbi:MAG: MCE family protein [Desulfobacteraceae bacterium]|nr:MCE family protein [Desulfobacteraceae bacterium]